MIDVITSWRAAATDWRRRVLVMPAVGHQPTRVYIDLSNLPGVAIATFRPIQTDPQVAHALYVLGDNAEATQAFTRIALGLAEKTSLLASQLEVAHIDSSRVLLFASALRSFPVLVAAEHMTLADESDLLAKRLEAKLAGPSQVEQNLRPPSGIQDVAQQAASPGFYDLALATLDDAKSLITFRRNRSAHPEWEKLSRTIPHHLIAAVDEWRQAASDASRAQHEHQEALAGTFSNEWIGPSRRDPGETVRMLANRAEYENDRLKAAATLMQETQRDRTLAETDVAETWLRLHGSAFVARFNEYRTALASRVQTIEAPRNGAYVLRGWKDTCACTVLKEIGEVLVQVLGDGEEPHDWWGTHCLAERFNALDHDAWRDLRIDVRQEAARADRVDAATAPNVEQPRSARRKRQATQPAAQGKKPTAAAIDAVAKQYLLVAMAAAQDAGAPYVPSREQVTAAVSKEIHYELTVEGLFGTTSRGGKRVSRHPEFLRSWKKVQVAIREAKAEHEDGE